MPIALIATAGSSPHTRGAPAPGFSIRPGAGIIPAYAGSTSPRRRSPSARRDHPRIRGEHRSSTVSGSPSHGSSPHTRGAPQRRKIAHHQQRIIPAYAGSTFRGVLGRAQVEDHPRIRGEHTPTRSPPVIAAGSSPHTRGAPSRNRKTVWRTGIIPAYAGSTFDSEFLCGPGTDHPRIRGEHPLPNRRRGQPGRIIPAYAGSTIASAS